MTITDPQPADGWTGYTEATLVWFVENYADATWMVHVTGMDDCHLRQDPDRDDDDPANPLLTEETATLLAAAFNQVARTIAEDHPADPQGFRPVFHATVFHHGVPVQPASVAESHAEIRATLDRQLDALIGTRPATDDDAN